MNIPNELIIHIIGYYPYYFYRVIPEYRSYLKPLLKEKWSILLRFLRKKVKLRKIFINEYLIKRRTCFTKKTYIKFTFLVYSYCTFYGMPEVIIGSYGLDSELLRNVPKDRNWITFYHFIKKNEILPEYFQSFIF